MTTLDLYAQLAKDFAAEPQPTAAEQAQYYLNQQAEATELSEREARLTRTQRVAQCNTPYGRYINPLNGKITSGVYHCGCWRKGECSICFDHRQTRLRGSAHKAVLDARKDGKNLKLVQADKSTVDKLTRGVDKSQYTRFPGADFDTLLIAEDECDTGEVICYDEISDLDWETIADTPKTRRASGKLGKSSAAPGSKNDNVAKVKVTSYVLHNDTTKEQESTALKAAIAATADLNPKTLPELQRAIIKRQSAFVVQIVKAGGKFLPNAARTIKVKVNLTRIEWKDYTSNNADDEVVAVIGEDAIPF